MSGKLLLDTNIVIALFAGEQEVLKQLAEAEAVFVSSVVVGELFYGAHKSRRVAENIARIEDFVAHSAVLSCDAQTSRWYGQIKSLLKSKGQPIPENDIWIAATALQHNLAVVTRDHHFKVVEEVLVIAW